MISRVCYHFNNTIYNVVWLNESANGIYIGIAGLNKDVHFSYHKDGNSHLASVKNEKREYSAESKWPAIMDVVETWPIIAHTIPLVGSWLKPSSKLSSDEKTKEVIMLGDEVFIGYNYLKVDAYLVNRNVEHRFLTQAIQLYAEHENVKVLTCCTLELDTWPQHKVGFILAASHVLVK